jgi:hypothetical protein
LGLLVRAVDIAMCWKGSEGLVNCMHNQKVVFEKLMVVKAASNWMCVLCGYQQNAVWVQMVLFSVIQCVRKVAVHL